MSQNKRKSPPEIHPDSAIETKQTQRLPEIYADGVTGALFGGAVTKIVLHSISESADGSPEERQIARIAIPTIALLEFCRDTLDSAAGIGDALVQSSVDQTQHLKTLIQESAPKDESPSTGPAKKRVSKRVAH